MSNNIFTQDSNKALLWEILEDSFNKIDNKEYNNFKIFFDNHIQIINNNLQKNGVDDLMEKNKYFIQNTLSLINSQKWKNIYNSEPYTIKDRKDKELNEFERRFMERQKEFTNLINIQKPKEISFEDSENEMPINNMNEILERLQIERNKQVENNNFQEFGSKKINILEDNNILEGNNILENNNILESNNILQDNKNNIPKKKVTFDNLINTIDNDGNNNVENISDLKEELNEIKYEISNLKELIKNCYDILINKNNSDN